MLLLDHPHPQSSPAPGVALAAVIASLVIVLVATDAFGQAARGGDGNGYVSAMDGGAGCSVANDRSGVMC